MQDHPRKNDQGRSVTILSPHVPTPLDTWANPAAIATVVPDGPMPPDLNEIPVCPWAQVPSTSEGWLNHTRAFAFHEPAFDPKGQKPAAGAVVVEPDGRIWMVAPTKAFGGYQATFPKGKAEGCDLRATALKEVFEESGLQVELFAHLLDVPRSDSHTRYYLARRLGGTPAAMCWESQAVHLVPLVLLHELAHHPNDLPILKALRQRLVVATRP